jgi:hypothetical protein
LTLRGYIVAYSDTSTLGSEYPGGCSCEGRVGGTHRRSVISRWWHSASQRWPPAVGATLPEQSNPARLAAHLLQGILFRTPRFPLLMLRRVLTELSGRKDRKDQGAGQVSLPPRGKLDLRAISRSSALPDRKEHSPFWIRPGPKALRVLVGRQVHPVQQVPLAHKARQAARA